MLIGSADKLLPSQTCSTGLLLLLLLLLLLSLLFLLVFVFFVSVVQIGGAMVVVNDIPAVPVAALKAQP